MISQATLYCVKKRRAVVASINIRRLISKILKITRTINPNENDGFRKGFLTKVESSFILWTHRLRIERIKEQSIKGGLEGERRKAMTAKGVFSNIQCHFWTLAKEETISLIPEIGILPKSKKCKIMGTVKRSPYLRPPWGAGCL